MIFIKWLNEVFFETSTTSTLGNPPTTTCSLQERLPVTVQRLIEPDRT